MRSFFPSCPTAKKPRGKELFERRIGAVLAGKFAGKYEKSLFDKFDASLPALPPWKQMAG